MSKRTRQSKFLEDINDIGEEFSEIGEDEFSENEDILVTNENESESTDTDNEEENIVNIGCGRKRRRLLSSSEESEAEINEQHVAIDGSVWEEIQIGGTPGRPPLHNIFRQEVGPTGYAKRHIMKGKVSTAFSLIIDHRIMNHIRTCTIEEANRVLGSDWSLSQEKLAAFIAILYARAAYGANNLKLSFLWNNIWGPKFFSETMSRNNFTEILRFIRFDKKSQRSERLKADKFAMVSTIWNIFIENSQNCYKPGGNITIDEQLFPTKVRCRFTQYMPNKPDKFGIKFWLASDVDSKYVINAFPYLGKDENRPSSVQLSEYVVLKLIEPFTGSGRTVTTDNFFTSKSLAIQLLAKRTTLVGTIRSNKRELPLIAKQKKDDMARFSSKIFTSDNCTLTIYKSKPNKKVLLLSSKHKFVSIENNDKRLPETVSYYNKTKFGVDMTDQMARKFTTKSKSCRWPLQVFFNILDLAGINAWILYKQTTGDNISRQDFLLKLAVELADDFRVAREQPKEKANTKRSLPNPVTDSNKRRRCQIGYCKENKTNKICSNCKKFVCGKCATETLMCKKCDV